jgi:hypothetical protein
MNLGGCGIAKIGEAAKDDGSVCSGEVRKRAPGERREPKLDAAGELALVARLRATPTATMIEVSHLAKVELCVVLGAQALQNLWNDKEYPSDKSSVIGFLLVARPRPAPPKSDSGIRHATGWRQRQGGIQLT